MRKLAFAVAILMGLMSLGGCVHYGQFRDDKHGPKSQSVWRPVEGSARANFYLAFIEVDEFGEMFDRRQLNHALGLIQEAKSKSKTMMKRADGSVVPTHNAVVVTFIHGWKNNASDSSGNVWGFRDSLSEIANALDERLKKRAGDDKEQFLQGEGPEPVVGIYIGWRGAVTNVGVVKEFTFFDRRNAAARIPGAHLTEILKDISYTAKSCIRGPDVPPGAPNPCPENSRTGPGTGSFSVIVGHSFGGQVLERTVTQALASDLLTQEAERKDRERRGQEKPRGNFIEPETDLIVMLNEAAPATEGKQLIDLLRVHKMQLCVKIEGGRCVENQPLILSITSTGDWATGLTLPVGQGASSIFQKKFRKYEDPQPKEIPSQRTYYLHSTAHLPALFNHVLGEASDPKIKKEVEAAREGGHGADVHCFTAAKIQGKEYCIAPVADAFNDTPYWVMQMGTEFVPDHGQIFRPAFRELLQQFLLQRFDFTQPGAPLKTFVKSYETSKQE